MAMEPRADLLLRWNPGQTDWGPNLVSRMCTARERGEGICERTVGKRSAGLMGRIHRYDQDSEKSRVTSGREFDFSPSVHAGGDDDQD